MDHKHFIMDILNDIGRKNTFCPDLTQKSLSRKPHRGTNFRFWIFMMPNISVNFGEKIGVGTRSKIKWQPTELFMDQTVDIFHAISW